MPNFVVKLGNGEEITSQGRCQGVTIKFPDLTVVQNCYLFLLEGSEVVLGLAWLDTFGDMIANFRVSRLIIGVDGRWVTLLGDPTLCYGGLALCSAMRTLQEGGTRFLV